MSTKLIVENATLGVSLDFEKKRHAAARAKRYRLAKQHRERPFRELFSKCRECGSPIAPSYVRQFCKGGACKNAFFQKVQVAKVFSPLPDWKPRWATRAILPLYNAGVLHG